MTERVTMEARLRTSKNDAGALWLVVKELAVRYHRSGTVQDQVALDMALEDYLTLTALPGETGQERGNRYLLLLDKAMGW